MKLSPDARLLKALRLSREPLPLTELASLCGVSPDAVACGFRDLGAAGYEISNHPHLGYRLESAPDRLVADDLAGMLEDCPLVREIVVLEETNSTNDRLLQLGQAGAGGGLVLFAERQSAGRGRLGRVWASAAHKGLWFSILIRPDFPVGEWTRLTTWAAIGVARGIESLVDCRATVKWPNDILLEGRKVVGILIESVMHNHPAESLAVVGIGVNVNHSAGDFPPDLRERAGSLAQFASRPVDRPSLASAILRELDRHYAAARDDFGKLLAEANERSHLAGRRVTVEIGGQPLEGIAEGLDDRGALLLRTASGEIVPVNGGEVTVRAYGPA